LTKDLFIGFGTNFWNTAIFVLPENYVLSDIEFVDLFFKLLPLILTLSGTFLAYSIYSFGLGSYFEIKKTSFFKVFYNFLSRKWYFDRLYNQMIGQNILSLGYSYSYKDIDRGIIEALGPSGVINTTREIFNNIKNYQTGNVFHYLFIFLVATLVIIFTSILITSIVGKSIFLCTLFFIIYFFY